LGLLLFCSLGFSFRFKAWKGKKDTSVVSTILTNSTPTAPVVPAEDTLFNAALKELTQAIYDFRENHDMVQANATLSKACEKVPEGVRNSGSPTDRNHYFCETLTRQFRSVFGDVNGGCNIQSVLQEISTLPEQKKRSVKPVLVFFAFVMDLVISAAVPNTDEKVGIDWKQSMLWPPKCHPLPKSGENPNEKLCYRLKMDKQATNLLTALKVFQSGNSANFALKILAEPIRFLLIGIRNRCPLNTKKLKDDELTFPVFQRLNGFESGVF